MRISDWSSDVCSSDLHMNEEAGAVWMRRLTNTYPSAVWLNPVPQAQWGYSQSVRIIRELMTDRMYPLTLAGLDDAMRSEEHTSELQSLMRTSHAVFCLKKKNNNTTI